MFDLFPSYPDRNTVWHVCGLVGSISNCGQWHSGNSEDDEVEDGFSKAFVKIIHLELQGLVDSVA